MKSIINLSSAEFAQRVVKINATKKKSFNTTTSAKKDKRLQLIHK